MLFWQNFNHWMHCKLSFWQLLWWKFSHNEAQDIKGWDSVVHVNTRSAAREISLNLVSHFELHPLVNNRYTENITWWRHPMETLSALLALCVGNWPAAGEFPARRPVTRSVDVFFDLRLNKRLSKQWWCWWCETPSRPLWRYCNG